MNKILITGAHGFLGQHTLAHLEAGGYSVVGVDRGDGDLTESGVAKSLLLDHGPDTVIHYAAQVGRVLGDVDPQHTINSNVLMTTLVAQACAEIGARMVFASTSEVYGDQATAICTEEHGPYSLPHNLYGLSKRWAEEAVRMYAPKWQIMRFSMPFGPGLPPGYGRAAIVNFLWQAYKGVPIPVHRNAARSWCWVGDTVNAIERVMTFGEWGSKRYTPNPGYGIYNVGRDDNEWPMEAVAQLACRITGGNPDLIELFDPPANQTVVKRLGTSKLYALGWSPEVSLEQGMRTMFKHLLNTEEVREYRF